ncbi:uncharacterized protein BYT42DRAFT_649271 [Radiomyces spectabilis]|uniref:uncharacterized protein n=1 Tax=Radiomyces spectabilis TaxID=64574 RepID=UPI00221F272A|nr:uncharacterized protein BYT42DRAFT_649271 [Radiomyces spectabilis]KAI8365368.1 hypothetical protein BYT42DRAFT_649271 [Radiomyces spectabilis]
MPTVEVARSPTISEHTCRLVECSWRRVLAIAQNHVDEYEREEENYRQIRQQHSESGSLRRSNRSTARQSDERRRSSYAPSTNDNEEEQRGSHEFYDRERKMIYALDSLFSLAYEGSGYLAFIATMTKLLDPDSPVAMAFLTHIIDRSALPSRTTMSRVSLVILSRLRGSTGKLQRILTLGRHRIGRLKKTTQHSWRARGNHTRSARDADEMNDHGDDAASIVHLKLNATILWSLLAEKFAGDMCLSLWMNEVGDLLLRMLADPNEDLMVRILSLLALEKFALTGVIKDMILAHPLDLRSILMKIMEECEIANYRIYLMSKYSKENELLSLPSSSTSPFRDYSRFTQPSASSFSQQDQFSSQSSLPSRPPTADKWNDMLRHLFKKLTMNITGLLKSRRPHGIESLRDDDVPSTTTSDYPRICVALEERKKLHSPHHWSDAHKLSDTLTTLGSQQSENDRYKDAAFAGFSSMNSFVTGFIPPEGPMRDEWTKYMQLSFCVRWALDNVFVKENSKPVCPWDLSHLNMIMNPFDATPNWKISSSGLEVRNDRPHFESIRSTACVKSGKWYYETLVLSSGIMQLGWATTRCRFTPEEGYGVGDDCNGFAFDTYRTAVWADGTAVYPQTNEKIRCRAGDVLGSYLDLDNGLCSYFINGEEIGLTVDFENPQYTHGKASSITETTDQIPVAPPPPPPPSSPSQQQPSSSDIDTLSTSDPPASATKPLGLYPAISLTTHQHLLLNFGDHPWLYPPPITAHYRGIAEAGRLDTAYKRRVIRWAYKRGLKTPNSFNKPPLRPKPAHGDDHHDDAETPTSDLSDETEDSRISDYDWDGPLCTICFSEPKDVILMPCQHGGLGQQCAEILETCPLCRAQIDERIVMEDVLQSKPRKSVRA